MYSREQVLKWADSHKIDETVLCGPLQKERALTVSRPTRVYPRGPIKVDITLQTLTEVGANSYVLQMFEDRFPYGIHVEDWTSIHFIWLGTTPNVRILVAYLYRKELIPLGQAYKTTSDLRRLYAPKSLFQGEYLYVDLHAAVLPDSQLNHSCFKYSILTFANLDRAGLGRSTLYESNLALISAVCADFSFADITYVSMRHACLARASFRNAYLRNVDFTYADLSGADFRGADVKGIDFTQAKTDRTLF